MATSKRDVTLGIEVETAGEDGIRRLASNVRSLAQAGGDAAPIYAEAADQLDRFADISRGLDSLKTVAADVDRLTQQQKQAATVAAELAIEFQRQAQAVDHMRGVQALASQAVRDAQNTLAAQRAELRQFVADTAAAERSSATFTTQQAEKRAAIEGSRAALRQAKDALADVTAETNRAVATEKAIQKEYAATARAAADSNQALRERQAALAEARAGLEALGAEVNDLTGAEERLIAAQREVIGNVAATRARVAREQAEADRLAALEARGLADALDRAKLAAQSELAAIRDSEKFSRDYAAAQAAAAAEIEKRAAAERKATEAAERLAAKRREQAEADRLAIIETVGLREAQQRATAAAESELAAIRESEQFIRRYTEAKREAAAAEAASANLAAQRREQAEADRLAALEARGLAEAQQRAAAAAQSELAAIRESERFMERYAQEAREAAVASGRLAASQQELSAAFGTTGLRSMQAIEAEVRRVERALSVLEAQQRAGTISAQDLARATSSAEVRLQQLRQEIERVPAVGGAFDRLGGQINNLISRFGALGAAAATVAVVVKPVIDATIQLESMNRVLTTVTGSSAEAARQIEFLRNVAQQSGQSVSAVGESYAKFVASASTANVSLATTQKVFAAVSMAAGNLGLGSEQAKRALEALSQIASKGTVSMEELRQQLGDALPGVLGLLAERLGLTVGQLTKLVESGELLSDRALPALADGLMKLGPASGEVSGMVAEFNRLKNVVLEAGTILTTGAFGQTVGVVLSGLSFAIQRIVFGAAMIGEAFTVTGKQIGTVIAALVSFDFKNLSQALEEIERESAERLGNLANRIEGVGTAASGVAPQVKAATTETAKLATAATASSAAVEKATPSLEAHGAAAQGAAQSATAFAAANTTVGTSLAANVAPLDNTAKSYEALVVKHNEQIVAADKSAAAAKKHAEAVKESGEATVKAIEIAGDDVATKRAQAQAAANTQRAVEAQAAADQRYADMLVQTRAERIRRLELEGASKAAIEDATKALDAKIISATADAEKSAAAAETARTEVAARQALADSLRDNSGRYEELTAAVVAARNEVLRLQTLESAGLATRAEVTESVRKLAVAYALQRDALADVTETLRLREAAVKVDNETTAAAITMREQQAAADLKVAQTTGNVRAAIEAEIAVKNVQIERVRATIAQKTSEAQASIAVLEAQRREITGTDDVSVAKRLEIDLRIQSQRAKIAEAEASKNVVRGIEAEIAAIRLKQNAQAGSLSSGFDATKNQARSTVGGATYDDQGFATGPDGQRITAGSQLQPPDGSGNWTFISDATALGGSQTVTLPNGRRVSGRGVQGVGYWVRTDGGNGLTIGSRGTSGAFGGGGTENAQGGLSVPAPPPAPAPAPVGPGQVTPQPTFTPQPVVINLNGQPTRITVSNLAEAQALQDLLRILAQGFNASEGGA